MICEGFYLPVLDRGHSRKRPAQTQWQTISPGLASWLPLQERPRHLCTPQLRPEDIVGLLVWSPSPPCCVSRAFVCFHVPNSLQGREIRLKRFVR